MPANVNPEEQDGGLPPPGTRWGTGAHSVLPYLTKTLQSRPQEGQDAREARTHERDHPTAPALSSRP